MEEANLRAGAMKRVKALRLFYVHASVYVAVNLLLTVINLATSSDSLWFYWAWLGWGIAIVVHGLSVIGLPRLWGAEWEERKVRELMDKKDS